MSESPFSSTAEPYANLLAAAESAHNHSQYKEAVILAQTAVEVFTEQMLGRLYTARNIEYLRPPFEHLLINYNIGNSKVSGLYIALSGDDIKAADFWSRFGAHVQLRNDLVHEGRDATQAQSRASLDTVNALIDHMNKFNSL